MSKHSYNKRHSEKRWKIYRIEKSKEEIAARREARLAAKGKQS